MAATNYTLRGLTNKIISDSLEDVFRPSFQSNLEKVGMAMRYANRTVSYYSPDYDYSEVQVFVNKNAKNAFDVKNNELGR